MKNTKKTHIPLFLLLIAIVITVLLVNFACKPEKEKMYVVGIINPHAEARESGKGFISKMKEFGYVEGENITYIKHESKENIDDALKEMVAKNVDMIFTYTTPAAKKAKQFTANTNIPVVFILFDAVEAGLVKSLSQPSGNLTGIQLRGSTAKSVEWLTAVGPDIKNMFVPIVYDTKAASLTLDDIKKGAAKLNVNIIVSESSTVEELHESLSSIPEDIDAIFIPHSILIEANLETIIDRAIELKIPLASSGHEHFRIGTLVCYGPEDTISGEQAARLADKILRGEPPGYVPVETSEFFLGINLQTARDIGIEVPEVVLKQANFIVR
ncbi:MAG: ABC transporter substrate-binding protein [Nitrospirota bacterium]